MKCRYNGVLWNPRESGWEEAGRFERRCAMTLFPNSNFPLRASDQEDVIRIYLELMQAWEDAGRPSAVTSNGAARPDEDGDEADLG
jgi:hypothetical protein